MKNSEIKIKHGSSSLGEFVKRQIASDEEVEAFDQYAEDEAKAEEIDDSLKNIYRDDDGNQVDVKKLTIKKKRGLFFNLFSLIVVLFVIAGSAYGAYNYLYLRVFSDKAAVSLEFSSRREVASGQEFFYDLNYKNEDKVGIRDIAIKALYPENFIFLESDPAPSKGNDSWEIAALGSRRSDSIRIKGKLVGQADSSSIISADLTYTPDNFSSEFKKSASYESKINSSGLDFSFDSLTSANIGEENEIAIKFKAKPENYIDTFRLTVSRPEEVEIITSGQSAATSSQGLIVTASGLDSWQFSNLGKNENNFKIKFKIKEKRQPSVNLQLKFEYPHAVENQPVKYYKFLEKDLPFEVIKSDLNVNLIINGSPFDQGANFGQTLNYSIGYANKGASLMKDVIIMAVLNSDFLDWQSLSAAGGAVSGNTVSWSKQEIPALAELASGGEGTIDFSIKLKPAADLDLSKAYQVKSYVNYSISGKTPAGGNQSNIIVNKINSDLNFLEQVRYFNDDNLAVGSGPLPPKVGEITSLKVYWALNNNSHELTDLRISVALPANVSWDGKNRAAIGQLDYDSQANQVVWRIDKLPAAPTNALAEFNIKLAPSEADRNKIVVVLPAASASARDAETGAEIINTIKAKTTKLEDDPLAQTDGIVR